MEAASGFEPLNRGFADPSLSHLGTPPSSGETIINSIRQKDLLSRVYWNLIITIWYLLKSVLRDYIEGFYSLRSNEELIRTEQVLIEEIIKDIEHIIREYAENGEYT